MQKREDVPCPFLNTDQCPVYLQEGECYQDVHHLWYPANEYKTKIEKTFRRLGSQTVQMCRYLHNTEHAIWIRTKKPTVSFMREAITQEQQKRK